MKTALFILLCIAAFAAVFLYTQANDTEPEQIAALKDDEPAVAAAVQPTPSPFPSLMPTREPVLTPDPTPPTITRLKVSAVGDLMCLYSQISCAKKGDEYIFDQCFAEVTPIISEADIAMGNFETLISENMSYTGAKSYEKQTVYPSDGSAPYTTTVSVGGNPRLNAPESFLTAAVNSGFDVLVTSNNHAFDGKHQGIIDTLLKLDEYGIYHTGSYALPEDKKPLVVSKNGVKIGVIAYTDLSNVKPGKEEAYMLDRYNEERLTTDIEAVKQAGAEFVIVYIHWGTANTHSVTSRQRKMAQFIADAGADLILGSHPHCLQTFAMIDTERGQVPVIYSLGNFISSMGRTINKDGVIVNFTLEKDYTAQTVKMVSLTYIPTCCTSTDTGNYIVLPATDEYMASSPYASALAKSRERTIKVLGETAAIPE